ncbi:MAG TPA: low specificity L-threonine aldolase [Bacillota bacterium]|nr:low specificity L-threonine aldolase [Bacillota bacterium]
MKPTKNFASDNNAGVHPEILKALAEANQGYCLAYGDDDYTRAAVEKFQEHFGDGIEVFFVANGTAANTLSLKAVTESYHGIICPATAHINTDECGAPERFTGCKLLTIPTPNGKIRADQIRPFLHAMGNQHHNQPRVISISQSTELGTVYTVAELRELADFAHQHGMLLQMDGARIANAAAFLGVTLNDITGKAGVDLLSFGGTKNGVAFGEAIVFFNRELAKDFKNLRKQGMQLFSKMRFLAAQFTALLSNDLWLKNAQNANRMAQLLASELAKIPQIRITQKVEANAVFAIIPAQFVPKLQARYYFYIWNDETSEARLMTAFDTTEADVMDFVKLIKETVR